MRWPEASEEFLESVAEVTVRFQEVDSMNVVWHGHYVTYFEEGRAAFGEEFGLSYRSVFAAGLFIPIVLLEAEYVAPARFGDTVSVHTRFHPDDAARLMFSYRIASGDKTLARGRTLQLFTDQEGNPVLTRPACYEGFLATWRGRFRTA